MGGGLPCPEPHEPDPDESWRSKLQRAVQGVMPAARRARHQLTRQVQLRGEMEPRWYVSVLLGQMVHCALDTFCRGSTHAKHRAPPVNAQPAQSVQRALTRDMADCSHAASCPPPAQHS